MLRECYITDNALTRPSHFEIALTKATSHFVFHLTQEIMEKPLPEEGMNCVKSMFYMCAIELVDK